jgi:hypothetical protein
MSNHVHLAVEVGVLPLGKLMHLVASRYARLKQRQVPTTGHLFERRYRAKLVDADRYLLALVRYIHCNPVRAGLVRDPGDYLWSSHGAYVGGAPPDWLAMAPTLSLLGGDPETSRTAYLRFMSEDPSADDLTHIRPAMRRSKARGLQPASAPWPDPSARHRPRTLEEIVVEVAAESGVDVALLGSRKRLPNLVRARTEIARRALREGAATLSEIATRFGRAPSSLSELLAK